MIKILSRNIVWVEVRLNPGIFVLYVHRICSIYLEGTIWWSLLISKMVVGKNNYYRFMNYLWIKCVTISAIMPIFLNVCNNELDSMILPEASEDFSIDVFVYNKSTIILPNKS